MNRRLSISWLRQTCVWQAATTWLRSMTRRFTAGRDGRNCRASPRLAGRTARSKYRHDAVVTAHRCAVTASASPVLVSRCRLVRQRAGLAQVGCASPRRWFPLLSEPPAYMTCLLPPLQVTVMVAGITKTPAHVCRGKSLCRSPAQCRRHPVVLGAGCHRQGFQVALISRHHVTSTARRRAQDGARQPDPA